MLSSLQAVYALLLHCLGMPGLTQVIVAHAYAAAWRTAGAFCVATLDGRAHHGSLHGCEGPCVCVHAHMLACVPRQGHADTCFITTSACSLCLPGASICQQHGTKAERSYAHARIHTYTHAGPGVAKGPWLLMPFACECMQLYMNACTHAPPTVPCVARAA